MDLYTLKNSGGAKVSITNYGAIVQSLFMPDRNGKYDDIVLGYDTIDQYEKRNPFFGAIVGRYGNRIKQGKFKLDGNTYQITINDNANSLHGGIKGFDKNIWNAEEIKSEIGPALKLTLFSPDGDQGFPGNLTLTVIYTLTNDNELRIDYNAVSDKTTIINLTHHSYFNLSGNPGNSILNNLLMINADKYTPIDEVSIPTGELRDVANSPMDFREPIPVGLNITKDDEQLKNGKGYDHNFILNNFNGEVRKAASLYDPSGGRFMEVFTDQPGIQFYSGNFLDGTITGKHGIAYKYRCALCLEAQNFPDSPNKVNFPSAVLQPGQVYKQVTIYKFSTK